MATRAVLFDIGGTLYVYSNGREARLERSRGLAERWGVDDVQKVGRALNAGMARASGEYFSQPYYLHRDFFETSARYAAEDLGVAADPAHVHWFLEHMQASGLQGVALREGVTETLTALRAMGLHVGLVSNADESQLDEMLDVLGLRALADAAICSETARSCKPDAAIFLRALQSAGCEPGEALFVGDTPDHDIAGAERVGMRTALIVEESRIAFDRGAARPGQVVIREIPEILDLL